MLYPPNDLDRPDRVLGLLGTLWSKTYAEAPVLRSVVQANLEVAKQWYLNMLEAVACISRVDVPLYHTENWTLLRLRQAAGDELSWCIPRGLRDIPLLMNRISDPSVVLHAGVDYTVSSFDCIQFRADPFQNPGLPQLQDGDDAQIALWAFKGKFDFENVYRHFGTMLGLHMVTSQRYKDTINAIMDCLVQGTSLAHLEALLALMYDVPLIREAREGVQVISEDRRGPFVATDCHIYRLPQGARASCQAGQELRAGDQLYPGFRVTPLWRRDSTPLPEVELPAGLAGLGPIRLTEEIAKDYLQNNCVLVEGPHTQIDVEGYLRRVLPPEISLLFAPFAAE